MSERDNEAAAFYEDPENRKPTGPPVKRKTQKRLTSHVPVRFTKSTIDQVKELADEDAVTVSSWIRGVVEREIRHRKLTTDTQGSLVTFEIIQGGIDVESISVPQAEPDPDLAEA
jgi:hypothetical protein